MDWCTAFVSLAFGLPSGLAFPGGPEAGAPAPELRCPHPSEAQGFWTSLHMMHLTALSSPGVSGISLPTAPGMETWRQVARPRHSPGCSQLEGWLNGVY